MQYYKGNALQKEPQLECEIVRKSKKGIFLRIVSYPFVLIYWIITNFIHISLED